jgi:hypothetical protein
VKLPLLLLPTHRPEVLCLNLAGSAVSSQLPVPSSYAIKLLLLKMLSSVHLLLLLLSALDVFLISALFGLIALQTVMQLPAVCC